MIRVNVYGFMPALLILLSLSAYPQGIPKNSNVIIVKGISYPEVLTKLLDSGYTIEKKDADLQTVRTENKVYPKKFNAAYKISVRVKDSVAHITGTFTAPFSTALFGSNNQDPLWNNDPLYYDADRKGNLRGNTMIGYGFTFINRFAKSFNKPLEYSKQ